MLMAEFVRRKKGLAQAEVAERAALSQPVLSRIERGKVVPFPAWKRRIALALGWTGDVEALFEEVEVSAAGL